MKSFNQLSKIGSFLLLIIIQNCNSQEQFPAKNLKSKVQILNVGTFHMGFSSDAHTVEYEEHNRKNIF